MKPSLWNRWQALCEDARERSGTNEKGWKQTLRARLDSTGQVDGSLASSGDGRIPGLQFNWHAHNGNWPYSDD